MVTKKFFEFGKFLDSQLKIDEIKSLSTSIKTNKEKIKVGFLSADLRGHHSISYFCKRHIGKLLFTFQ